MQELWLFERLGGMRFRRGGTLQEYSNLSLVVSRSTPYFHTRVLLVALSSSVQPCIPNFTSSLPFC